LQKVLFVDDEENIVKSLRRMVRAEGLECETFGAYDGREALEFLEKQDVDLVVSDIRMPMMDGVEFLTRLRGMPQNKLLPVIMLTAETDLSVRNVALGMGATDYLNKPVDPNEMAARLRNALRLKSFQDEILKQSQELQIQLEQAQRLELAGLIAVQAVHDLKNALTGIIGSAQLIMVKNERDEDHEDLERILLSARYATNLTRHILDSARCERDPEKLNEPTDICRAVDDCVQMISACLPPDVQVHWSRPGAAAMVSSPRTETMQVITNLLHNSAQAMGDAGVVKLNIDTEADPDSIVVTVTDNGPGMKAEVAERIFEPFVTTKSSGKGSGLGLSTVKRIMERYDGSISVSSPEEGGAAFELRFTRSVARKEELEKTTVGA